MKFDKKDIRAISKVLGVKLKRVRNFYAFEIGKLHVEIYPELKLGRKKGCLISVYTPKLFLQLHFCSAYYASELLGEVIFVSESDGKISGLAVDKNGGCSFYANIDREIISSDFTKLEPQVMLPAISLSLAENLMEKKKQKC